MGRWDDWLDKLFPPPCQGCGEPSDGTPFCAHCLPALLRNAHPCRACALPLPAGAELCGQCLRKRPPQSRSLAPFLYAEPIDRLLTALKFRRDLAAGRALAGLVADAAMQAALFDGIDLAVAVPLHPDRLRQRGYNQALELLRGVLRRQAVGLSLSALARQRATTPQTGLDARARRRNLRGAFVARSDLVRDRRVLLMDDVVTTGTTVGEAAATLLKAGAAEVRVLAVARVA